MNIVEQLTRITSDIQGAIISMPIGTDETYQIADPATYHNAVKEFSAILINERHPDYSLYLDIQILIGKIQADLRDKPADYVNIRLDRFDMDDIVVDLARKLFGTEDRVGELLLLNHSFDDGEIREKGKIILPTGEGA